jgi:two-component system NtrC family sensor kinase
MSDAESPARLYFDQDITLPELLKVVDLEPLRAVLVALLGPDLRLLDSQGTVILGGAHPPAGAVRRPVRLELEPIGYLEAAPGWALDAGVALMEILSRVAARYLMAAILQMESVRQDYAELQEKNARLQASEERYRELAANLERRVAEQVKTIEATQRQLYQAEKLASVGQLAAGVAHEINNPLGFVRSNLNTAAGYVQQIARVGAVVRTAPDPKRLAAVWQDERLDAVIEDFPILLQESIEGVERVAKIVAALKDFSSIDRAEETLADVNALIRTTCQVAASELGERVRLVTDFAPLPALRCHAGRLSQVFLNLLLNAVQAISGTGEVRIATRADRQAITVTVTDTGHGMPPEVQARIFEPFFTTREVGRGTGLGLTVARDVVQAHGGRIAVQSAPGAGTTFTIHLPLTGQAP